MSERDDIEAMIATLEAKRDALNQAIAGLRASIGASGGDMPTGGGTPREIRSDTFWGKSIPDATKQFLQMSGKRPQTTQAIADALQKGGLTSKSDNFANVVQTILRRTENQVGDVIRTPGGEWALPEWYGKTPRPVKKSNDKTDTDKTETPQADAAIDAVASGDQTIDEAITDAISEKPKKKKVV